MNEATVFAVLASMGCIVVWFFVVRRAVQEKVSLVLLALVLIILGLAGSGLLAAVGIPTPGAWTLMGAGIALLLLWPRHEGSHTCPVCGHPHSNLPPPDV